MKTLMPNVPVTSFEQSIAIQEVLHERRYQDTLWGPAFERDHMTEEKWINVLDDIIHAKGRYAGRPFDVRMKKATAVGLAIMEWRKRQQTTQVV